MENISEDETVPITSQAESRPPGGGLTMNVGQQGFFTPSGQQGLEVFPDLELIETLDPDLGELARLSSEVDVGDLIAGWW